MFHPRYFEWDSEKANANFAKHGLDFSFAVQVFDDAFRVTWDVSRPGDHEPRWKVAGRIGTSLHALVFTVRGDIVRVISARRTNRSEERRYGDRSI
ncbi:BrnT family toxin [uncultured Alsobacter sp.]|uniref:BrnT family toxin n=1 Tax=uncultured Alsobacter sp. TaxID=1748258 RepID=UPI00345D68CF